MSSKGYEKENKQLTYEDFDIDEGLSTEGAVTLVMNDIYNYSIKALKFFAEQLRVKNWREISNHRTLAGTIVNHYNVISHDSDTDEYNENRLNPIKPVNPVFVYFIERTAPYAKVLTRLFEGNIDYVLQIKDGIPVAISYIYPLIKIDYRFDDGKLTTRTIYFRDYNLEVVDSWDDSGLYARNYFLRSGELEEISREKALALVKPFTDLVKNEVKLPSELSSMVGDYLWSID